jgi:maleylacetate reductase
MTMHKFIYSALPSRVIFGPGSIAQLAQEIDALGAKRALVLCTPEQKPLAEKIANQLGERAAGIFDRAVMHVPSNWEPIAQLQ